MSDYVNKLNANETLHVIKPDGMIWVDGKGVHYMDDDETPVDTQKVAFTAGKGLKSADKVESGSVPASSAHGIYNYPIDGASYTLGDGDSNSNRSNLMAVVGDEVYIKGLGGYKGKDINGSKSLHDLMKVAESRANKSSSSNILNTLPIGAIIEIDKSAGWKEFPGWMEPNGYVLKSETPTWPGNKVTSLLSNANSFSDTVEYAQLPTGFNKDQYRVKVHQEKNLDLQTIYCAIKVTSAGNGSAIITDNNKTFKVYQKGEQGHIKASPYYGYEFDGWYENNSNKISRAATELIDVNKNRDLTARFVKTNYHVTISDYTGNLIDKDCKYMETIEVDAHEKSHYTFVGWYENGRKISSDKHLSIEVTGTRTIEAQYDVNSYHIKASDDKGVLIDENRNYNSSVTIEQRGKTGYVFEGWYEDGRLVSRQSRYTFTVDGPHTFEARYGKDNYVIYATNNINSTVILNKSFEYQDTCTVVAPLISHYNFVAWYEDNSLASRSKEYSFTVERSRNLVANYTVERYKVKVTDQDSVLYNDTYDYGTILKLKAKGKTGYNFDGWSDGVRIISTKEQFDYTVESTATITAQYSKGSYHITVTGHNGAKVVDSNYEYNSLCSFSAPDVEGHSFDGWYEDGRKISGWGKNVSFNVTSSRNIVGKYSKKHFTISVSSNSSYGSASGGGDYEYDSTATVKASVDDSDYDFDGWYEDGRYVSGSSKYTFTVKGNRHLEARFTYNPPTQYYTISTSGEHCSTTGGGAYEEGSKCTVSAKVDSGYEFDGWYEDGSKVSSSQGYSFTVNSSRTLVAKAVELRPIYTISTDGRNCSTSGGGHYDYGSSCTVKATVNEGCTWDGWYEGSQRVSTDKNYTFTVKSSRTLVAKANINKYRITASDYTGTIYNRDVEYGTEVSFTAHEQEGYDFAGWYEGESKITNNLMCKFIVRGIRTLIAKYFKKKYTVTVSNNRGLAGILGSDGNYGSKSREFYYNDSCTIRVRYNDNNVIWDGWYENDVKVSSDETYTFKVKKSHNLVAKFHDKPKPKHKVIIHSLSPQLNITFHGEGSYAEGSRVTVSADVPDGTRTVMWAYGHPSNQVSNSTTYSFDMPTQDVELYFGAVGPSYRITIKKVGQGTVTGDGDHARGSRAVCTATPAKGWKFVGWSGEGKSGTDDVVFESLDSDKTLTATFKEMQPYKLNLGAGAVSTSAPRFRIYRPFVQLTIYNGDKNDNNLTNALQEFEYLNVTVRFFVASGYHGTPRKYLSKETFTLSDFINHHGTIDMEEHTVISDPDCGIELTDVKYKLKNGATLSYDKYSYHMS